MGFNAAPDTPLPAKKTVVAAHERKTKPVGSGADESSLFFDDKRVPLEVIDGIRVSRPWLTQLTQSTVALLELRVAGTG